jgi:hypothetical protein
MTDSVSIIDRLTAELAEAGMPAVPEEELMDLARRVYDDLERAVGEILMHDLDEHELRRFEDLMEAGNEEATRAHLHAVAPHYALVVEQQLHLAITSIGAAARVYYGGMR